MDDLSYLCQCVLAAREPEERLRRFNAILPSIELGTPFAQLAAWIRAAHPKIADRDR